MNVPVIKDPLVEFSSLDVGVVFEHQKHVYIKLETEEAADLASGTIHVIDNNEMVTHYPDASVILKPDW